MSNIMQKQRLINWCPIIPNYEMDPLSYEDDDHADHAVSAHTHIPCSSHAGLVTWFFFKIKSSQRQWKHFLFLSQITNRSCFKPPPTPASLQISTSGEIFSSVIKKCFVALEKEKKIVLKTSWTELNCVFLYYYWFSSND